MADLLVALGKDPTSQPLSDTPRRVAYSYAELFAPREFDASMCCQGVQAVRPVSARFGVDQVFDKADRILLVQPTYKDHWDIPGGYVETGETPAQAAAREVREELGIETAVGPLLVADWAPHPDEGDKLLLIFDGGTLTAEQINAIRLQADELASYAFRDPAEAVTLLIPRLGRRVAAAIDAHQAGHTTYLECGVRTSASNPVLSNETRA